jgi:hypothetical protein
MRREPFFIKYARLQKEIAEAQRTGEKVEFHWDGIWIPPPTRTKPPKEWPKECYGSGPTTLRPCWDHPEITDPEQRSYWSAQYNFSVVEFGREMSRPFWNRIR